MWSPSRNTIARKPSHFGSKSQPSPGGSSVASFASIGSTGGAIGKLASSAEAISARPPKPSTRAREPRRDPPVGRRPAGVERVPGLVEVDQERRVVGGRGLALARLAVDLGPHATTGHARGREQMVDPHAEVLVEVA